MHDYAELLPGGVTLLPGSGGIFEVDLGTRKLFSKEKADRFPEKNEIEGMLEGLLEPADD